MTTKKEIINNCKKGLITIIQDDTENYMAFSNHKDYDGNYRTSSWVETIEETKRCIGVTYGYSEKEIEVYSEEYNWKIVEVYREEVEPFKVGDKVKILPSIKNANDWEFTKEYFSNNMEGKIISVFNNIDGLYYTVSVYDSDKSNFCYYISHQYLAPLYEEKEDEEIIQIGDQKYNKKEVEKALRNIKPIKEI